MSHLDGVVQYPSFLRSVRNTALSGQTAPRTDAMRLRIHLTQKRHKDGCLCFLSVESFNELVGICTFPDAVGPTMRLTAPRLKTISSLNRSSKRSRVLCLLFFPWATLPENASQEKEHALNPIGGSPSNAGAIIASSSGESERESVIISVYGVVQTFCDRR